MENEVIKAIHERRSIRSYSSQPIPEDLLRQILEAGTWAPTAMNRQDPLIVAVTKPELLQKLRRLNAEILGTQSDPYYGAPCIILVFASESNYNKERDGSLVLGTLMLAAHALGVGTCWINREDKMFLSVEGAELLETLGVPKGYVGIGGLAAGMKSKDAHPQPAPRKEGYFKIVS